MKLYLLPFLPSLALMLSGIGCFIRNSHPLKDSAEDFRKEKINSRKKEERRFTVMISKKVHFFLKN
jgi:hypothetical protein